MTIATIPCRHRVDSIFLWGIAGLAEWTTVCIELDQTTGAYIATLCEIAQRFAQRELFCVLQERDVFVGRGIANDHLGIAITDDDVNGVGRPQVLCRGGLDLC